MLVGMTLPHLGARFPSLRTVGTGWGPWGGPPRCSVFSLLTGCQQRLCVFSPTPHISVCLPGSQIAPLLRSTASMVGSKADLLGEARSVGAAILAVPTEKTTAWRWERHIHSIRGSLNSTEENRRATENFVGREGTHTGWVPGNHARWGSGIKHLWPGLTVHYPLPGSMAWGHEGHILHHSVIEYWTPLCSSHCVRDGGQNEWVGLLYLIWTCKQS